MLSSITTASEMATRALNNTFQDHILSAETFFTDLVNSSLEVQPFANCQPMEGLNAVTLHIHVLNNSNATSTILISTEPIQTNRTVSKEGAFFLLVEGKGH